MKIEVKVDCPVEHAFTSGGAAYETVKTLRIEAYYPGPTSPRVKLVCPNGDQLVIEASRLMTAVGLASVRV